MTTKVKNMTSGSPGKLIILFAIPLMLGNIFQQLYTMVDTIIVGQIIGVEALAAVGATDWLIWFVLGVASGMTQGYSILVSQFFGAKDYEKLRKAVARSYVWAFGIAVVVMAVSQIVLIPVLKLLQTPENIMGMAQTYARIMFCGVPVIAAYNVLAAILRALGNSRSPLIAMAVACVVNITLDILFVGGFHWGVAGAAAATVLAQGTSAVFCFAVLRKVEIIRLAREDFQRNGNIDLQLNKLGAPVAVQNSIIAVGGMIVQYVVNGFGFLFVAGFTATNKLYGLLEMAAIAYGYAITTYVGQNLGAGEIQRIRKGVNSGAVMCIVTSAVISVAMILFGRPILSMFISGEPDQAAQVLRIAYKYLFIMALFLWVLYLLYVYRSALQGLGNTIIPMASGMAEFAMRVGCALFLPRLIGQEGIFYAEISAWTGAALLLAASYFYCMRNFAKAPRTGKRTEKTR